MVTASEVLGSCDHIRYLPQTQGLSAQDGVSVAPPRPHGSTGLY